MMPFHKQITDRGWGYDISYYPVEDVFSVTIVKYREMDEGRTTSEALACVTDRSFDVAALEAYQFATRQM